jgi:predicted MFS family arabinose efflux permease
MFGPLNGVRVALVTAAVIAAILGAVFGQWVMTGLLFAGVAVHGWGWWYLYKRHQRETPSPDGTPVTG